MSETRALELLVAAPTPVVLVESDEEQRVVELLRQVAVRLPGRPLFVWSVTEGLRRMEEGYSAQKHNAKPVEVLTQIKDGAHPGVYLLLDFHPFLADPVHVRLLKEIALAAEKTKQTLVLASHALDVPAEIRPYCARFVLPLPGTTDLEGVVRAEAETWARRNGPVRGDPAAVQMVVRNLAGLTRVEARRLARQAIQDDGAITPDDVRAVARAKHDLVDPEGVLSLDFDVARYADVGGLRALQQWLAERQASFLRQPDARGLDVPRGILLLGVQGCGKSLAAKAVAGTWGVPLLRLDFGRLYDKYVGETERRLHACLRTCEVMAPCVLWVDEIEKGLAIGDQDGGTAHRVLGILLTWMAENQHPVFLVATSNDVRALPPELIRKGRLDEIFFVDLPRPEVRGQILAIHLRKRGLDPRQFDLAGLAAATDGFSGAELEQAVVSALYAAHARHVGIATEHLLAEVHRTRPLAVVMAERVEELRAWAAGRTVPAD